MTNICAVILAAGRGTRMPSPRPKALQSVLGEAMLSHVYTALTKINADIWTVVGHGADEVQTHIKENFGTLAYERCVLQEEQLGTGHAVLCALNAIRNAGSEKGHDKRCGDVFVKGTKILVVNADTPLIGADILQEFVEKAKNIPLAFMSLTLDNPASYGRVLREEFANNVTQTPSTSAEVNAGAVKGIIEAKDFRKEFPGSEIYEVNAGIYLFDVELLEKLLPQVSTANAGGEYYLTDMVGLAKSHSFLVDAISLGNSSTLLGVNNPLELYLAEKQLQETEVHRRMSEGVVIHAPELVRISPFANIEAGVEIFGPCEIYGNSSIGKDTRIESHSYIKNTRIGSSCVVRSFCHFENASVANNVQLGPYARLRPQAELADNVHIGNFVEIKKSTVAINSKINHFTYIGDSVVGSGVNIGAGCITCNYDGKNKHQTIIGDNAFLGSNCSFVAPVTIGKNALVGAGSVITHDIPDNNLAIARGKQINIKK